MQGHINQIPRLLNGSFAVHSYDGGSFGEGIVSGNYGVENLLQPTRETFHCSDSGTRKNLVLRCCADFTLTHIFIQAPKRKCTEPIRNCLVWVTDQEPNVGSSKYFDDQSVESIRMKYTDCDPLVVSTDPDTFEGEIELQPWRSGRYVHLKLFDSHSDTQENIDVAVVGLVGFLGRVPYYDQFSRSPSPLFGPWCKRRITLPRTVHPHELSSTFSNRGWCCDGRDFSGACRGGFNDFNETSAYDVTFRCSSCGFDLCEYCAADKSLGKVTRESASSDLSQLRRDGRSSAQSKRLAFSRVKTSLRTDPNALATYLEEGLIDILARLKFPNSRDAASLLQTVLSRLSPIDNSIVSPQLHPDLWVYNTGDLGSGPQYVSVPSATRAYGVECIDISSGLTATFASALLLPVANSSPIMERTAHLFAVIPGASLGEVEEILAEGMVDFTIRNLLAKSVLQYASDCGQAEDVLAFLRAQMEAQADVTRDDVEMDIQEMVGFNSAMLDESDTNAASAYTAKDWLDALRSRIADRLVSQLAEADTLDADLVRSLLALDVEFSDGLKIIILRLLNSGLPGEVVSGLRLLAKLVTSDSGVMAGKFDAQKWAQKCKSDSSAELVELILSSSVDTEEGGGSPLSRPASPDTLAELTTASAVAESVCEELLLTENFQVKKIVNEKNSKSGFSQITTPIAVTCGECEWLVEPLVALDEVKRCVLATQPIRNLEYLKFCYELVGSVVDLDSPPPSGRGLVVGFDFIGNDVGVHRIKFDNSHQEQLIVLALRQYTVVERHHEGIDIVAAKKMAHTKAHLAYWKMSDIRLTEEIMDMKDSLSEPNHLVIVEDSNSTLHELLPMVGLTHTPRGWLVPSSGLDRDILAFVHNLFPVTSDNMGTTTSAHRSLASSDVSLQDESHIFAVSIQVDVNEISFDVIWPIIKDEVFDSIRPVVHRAWPGLLSVARIEQGILATLTVDGAATVARGLSRNEAELVASRLVHVVQCLVVEDRASAIAAETERQRLISARSSDRSTNSVEPAIVRKVGERIKWSDKGLIGFILGVRRSGSDSQATMMDVIDPVSGCVYLGISSLRISGNDNVGGSAGSINAMRVRLRETLRRRFMDAGLGEDATGGGALPPSLIQLGGSEDDDDPAEIFHPEDDDDDEEEEPEHVFDGSHEEARALLRDMMDTSSGRRDGQGGSGSSSDSPAAGPTGGMLTSLRRVGRFVSGGLSRPAAADPMGGFFVSIGDLLSGITFGSDSPAATEEVPPLSREIDGITRGASLNAGVMERLSPDDLLRPGGGAALKPRTSTTFPTSPISAEEGTAGLTGYVRRAHRIAEDEGGWFALRGEGSLVSIIAYGPGETVIDKSGVRFECRFEFTKIDTDISKNKRQRLSSAIPPASGPPPLAGVDVDQSILSKLSLLERCLNAHKVLHDNAVYQILKQKISRKIASQLDQTLVLLSDALIRSSSAPLRLIPPWLTQVAARFPWLVPESLRQRVFLYTSLPASLTIHWIQQHRVGELLAKRAQIQSDLNSESGRRLQQLSQELSNVEERIVRNAFWFGCVKSCLAKLRKSNETEFVRMSDSLLERTAASPALLEIQFEGESGFGSAVTRSFFSEVGKTFLKNSAESLWWVSGDSGSEFRISRRGLLLRPMWRAEKDRVGRVMSACRLLGRLIGRALAEGYIVPIALAIETWAMIRDPSAERPVSALPMPGDGTDGEFLGTCALFVDSGVWRHKVELPDVGAVFVETGFSGGELVEGGRDISVNYDNVAEFVRLAKKLCLHEGIDAQIQAIRAGVNDVLPVDSLLIFSPEELKTMVCGQELIEWDAQVLKQILTFHDGVAGVEAWLIEILLEMNNEQRSTFLDFVTSCPRMPPGGNLKIDVFSETIATSNLTSPVLRPSIPPQLIPGTPPDVVGPSNSSGGAQSPSEEVEVMGYPRSRACVNHLYLPRYRSRETLRERLQEAMVSSVHHDEIAG